MSVSSEPGSIHGHDLINLIHHAEPAFTRVGLAAAVAERFGPQPRFHTCSAAGMTLDGLLEFLLVRGKIVERDGRFYTDMSKVCSHGNGNGDDHGH